MSLKDLVVSVFEELQPQVAQLSVSITNNNGKAAIGVSFLPKGNLPLSITVPDNVCIILERAKQRIVAL